MEGVRPEGVFGSLPAASPTGAAPRIGDKIEGVAHRIWYAVVKEA